MDARRRDSFGDVPVMAKRKPARPAPLLAQRSKRKFKRIGSKKFLRLRREMNAKLEDEIAEERGAITEDQQAQLEPLPPGVDQLPDHMVDNRSFIGPDPRWPRDKYWLRDD